MAELKETVLKLPAPITDVVDKLFSHNEFISLWIEEKNDITFHTKIWSGMAWDIPDEFKSYKFVRIFGTVPESIVQADTINIEVI